MTTESESQRAPAIAALVFAVLFIGGVFLYAWQGKGPRVDNEFCPLDNQYPRTAILLDASDSLTPLQVKTAEEHVEQLAKQRLPLHEWVGIFVLHQGNLAVPKPKIALCNPGDEKNCNSLIENCNDAEDIFHSQFVEPMAKEIRQLSSAFQAGTSPIFEMIRAVASSHGFNSSQQRRLIIISDMLHNTRDYSHYRDGFDFDAWSQSGYASNFLELSLSGVTVEIWYIRRLGLQHLQTGKHVEFWNQYFSALGARVKRVLPL